MFEIIPGVLEKEWAAIEKKLELIKSFAKTVHIDIIDGKFVNNTTFLDPKPFQKYSQDLFLEVHLMVDDPIKYLDSFAAAGFRRFLGHIEKMPDQSAFVAKGQELGEVGLAIDGPTELDAIKVDYTDLDTIIFYTGQQVGFSGAAVVDSRLEKIKKFRESSDDLFPIEVDGGISGDSIVKVKQSGATRFISTGFIFGSNDPKAQYKKLHDLVNAS